MRISFREGDKFKRVTGVLQAVDDKNDLEVLCDEIPCGDRLGISLRDSCGTIFFHSYARKNNKKIYTIAFPPETPTRVGRRAFQSKIPSSLLPAKLWCKDHPVLGQIRNISLGGVLLDIQSSIPALHLRSQTCLEIGFNPRILVQAELISIRLIGTGTQLSYRIVGLEYERNDRSTLSEIIQFVSDACQRYHYQCR